MEKLKYIQKVGYGCHSAHAAKLKQQYSNISVVYLCVLGDRFWVSGNGRNWSEWTGKLTSQRDISKKMSGLEYAGSVRAVRSEYKGRPRVRKV